MEDRHVILKAFPNLPGSSWIGVYDGNGGEEAAEYALIAASCLISSPRFAKNKLHEFVVKQPALSSDRAGALRQAFIEADQAFLALCESKLWVLSHVEAQLCFLLTLVSSGQRHYRSWHLRNRWVSVYRQCRSQSASLALLLLSVIMTGDCRAVLGRSGACVPLSYDHKPLNPTEATRIRNAGLSVDSDGRVLIGR